MEDETGGNKILKKLVGILVALVIVLGGLLIFEYTKDNGEKMKAKGEITTASTEEAKNHTRDNRNYQFKDIESIKKATSIKEAYERIFGKERLFDDFKDSESYSDYERSNFNDPFKGEIKYYVNGVYKTENTRNKDGSLIYYPENQYYYDMMNIDITLKPSLDTRMEMIDFLHYLQYSGLTKPHFIKESLPEDFVMVMSVNPKDPEEIELEPFMINMRVYQQIKPGMNMPESHQGWSISSDVIEVMDFSDKEGILNSIHQYGKFEGVNPSGMK